MNFSNSKIYKLISNLTKDIYIGSTTRSLKYRLAIHKAPSNEATSKKLFDNGAIVNIVLIEDYPCACKNDLKLREIHYINTIPCINKNRPFISNYTLSSADKKEWTRQYRNEHIDKMKSYNNLHKDQIKLNRLQNYKNKKIKQQMIHGFLNLPFHLVY